MRGRSPRAPLGGGTFVLHPAVSVEAVAPAAAEPAAPPQQPQAQAAQPAAETPAHQNSAADAAASRGMQPAGVSAVSV